MINQIVLMGRPAKDLKIESFTYLDQNGDEKVLNKGKFILVVNKTQDKKYFFMCEMFGSEKRLSYAAGKIQKGKRLYITGVAEPSFYEKDGVKQYTFRVSVQEYHRIDYDKENNASDAVQEAQNLHQKDEKQYESIEEFMSAQDTKLPWDS